MNIFVEKSNLIGEVDIIASKSYAHRILICSAFSNAPTKIYNLPNSEDINATISCLKSLGVRFDFNENEVVVYPTKIQSYNVCLNAGESGSTLRFFLPIVSALGGEYLLKGTKKLISRPSFPLLETLKQNGINYFIGEDYIKIVGKLTSGNFTIDASLSSQYLTGLMLACPLMDFNSQIVCDKLSSSDYVNITLDVLKTFGVKVECNSSYKILGKFLSPKSIAVEGDYSNALFFAVGGLLCGDVLIKGLNKDSIQGDKKAFEILKNIGGEIAYEKNGIRFKKSNLTAIDFNVDDIPDSAPCLALAVANSNGKSMVSGVDRLKIKESDRLNAIMDFLSKAGGEISYKEGVLTINPTTLTGGVFDGFNDHRIVMTLAILGCLVGRVEIVGAEAVNKSYPDFFKRLKSLGGQFWIK